MQKMAFATEDAICDLVREEESRAVSLSLIVCCGISDNRYLSALS
jgi:hypothetical protein